MRIFLLGHPGLYGGAGTEAHHQLILWWKMGMTIHIIPSMGGYQREPLYEEMLSMGITYEEPLNFDNVHEDDMVINFCGDEFLEHIDSIYEKTKKTVFVNCMTWLFPKEIRAHVDGKISYSLYQNPVVCSKAQRNLKSSGTKAEFETFTPYFHHDFFPYQEEETSKPFVIGRISRVDDDKFSKDTFHIWDTAVSPVLKKGIVLGFDQRSEKKTGKPPEWVETYRNHSELSVQDFYKQCHIIVQSTDTRENWPRIAFEAMNSGCPLVVNNRGGWRQIIEHGKSGFLCRHDRDFIYWTSRLAYEPKLREEIRINAWKRAQELGGFERSRKSWQEFFDKVSRQ